MKNFPFSQTALEGAIDPLNNNRHA